MGGFLDRELTTFQTQAAIGKEISAKCDASVFAVCQMPQHSMGNTQAMFRERSFDFTMVLIFFEVKGLVKGVKGAFKCSLSMACEGCDARVLPILFRDAIILFSAIQNEHHSGCI